MNSATSPPNWVRLIALGLLIGLAAYWAGARWGPRSPETVQALPEPQQRPAAAAMSSDESSTVQVYRQTAPAVANIVTRNVEYNFFMQPVAVEGAGSGFVIDAQGHILTNFHVVEGAESIEVALGPAVEERGKGARRYTAKFIGADPRNDIALIKIDPQGQKLKALALGDSSTLQVGQRVLAIGNPFGFQSTLTTGVVSALGRTVQTSERTFIDAAIQTDAAINQGNSGGPLLDSHGQVIGINSAIYTPTGATAGIGFAIPINTAKQIAQDLITEGRVRRAYLGIEETPVWPQLAEALEIPVETGLLIERVTPGSPAESAGLRGGTRRVLAGRRYLLIGGDVLVEADGQEMINHMDLNLLLNRKRPGDVIRAVVYRGRQKMDVKITLGERR